MKDKRKCQVSDVVRQKEKESECEEERQIKYRYQDTYFVYKK